MVPTYVYTCIYICIYICQNRLPRKSKAHGEDLVIRRQLEGILLLAIIPASPPGKMAGNTTGKWEHQGMGGGMRLADPY